jgi:ribosomal protein S18 acetylase RimI-like enzyme
MSTTARPMSADELDGWLAGSKAGLVAELVHAGRDPDKARARVDARYEEWFPAGRPADGHHVYVVERDDTSVATFWLGPHPDRPADPTVAWLYDIEVNAPLRGRGIGRHTLALAEDAARARGAVSLDLNVFGANQAARALYRSAGYTEVAVTLAKPLNSDADMAELTRRLQEAVRVRDRAYLEAAVSERMIWVMPSAGNRRGKRDWIDGSCSVDWDWFEIEVVRVVDLGSTRVVECWINQQYRPKPEAGGEDALPPVSAAGAVCDVWSVEDGEWRLVARHPQRAPD